MRKFSICVGIATFFISGMAMATCLVMPPADVNNSSEFLVAVVRSLGAFRDAQTSTSGMAEAKDATDILSTFDVATDDFNCAAERVHSFESSADKDRSQTIAAMQKTASVLISLNAETKAMMVEQLNGDFAGEKTGDHALRMSAMAKRYRDAWGLLPIVAEEAFLTLVEYESQDGKKYGRLAITTADRDVINKTLLEMFPSVLNEDKGAARSQAELAAYLIFVGLNKKSWRMHDQPYISR